MDSTSVCRQGHQRRVVLSAPNSKMSCSSVSVVCKVTPYVVQEQVVTPMPLITHREGRNRFPEEYGLRLQVKSVRATLVPSEVIIFQAFLMILNFMPCSRKLE